MFSDSSGTEMDVDVEATMETESRPIVDREEKLRKVEERLLSNKTYESFTNCDGVMTDDNLSLPHMTTFHERILVINSCDFPLCSAKDEDWD